MAEALNRAGYPRYAFQILSSGVNTDVLQDSIIPRYRADSLKIMDNFNFPGSRFSSSLSSGYIANTNASSNISVNTIGIHSRGCGFTPMDTTYVLPNDTIELDAEKRAQLIKEHQAYVDKLILTESALEFALEGTRYYDIMRYALRQDDPGATMMKIIGARKGQNNPTTFNLANQQNWFIKWKNKVGY